MTPVTSLSLTHNGDTKTLLLYPGISEEEFLDMIAAAYDVDGYSVKAVMDTETDEIISVAAVCSQVGRIKRNSRYELLINPNQHGSGVARARNHIPTRQRGSVNLANETSLVPSNVQASELGNLSDLPLTHEDISSLVSIFKEFSPEDALDRDGFEQCFQEFIRRSNLKSPERARLTSMLEIVFNAFDADGNGLVDSTELLSGLTVLCSGDREDKIKAAFNLYDINHDGYISYPEMAKYLTAVFTVIYQNSKELFHRHDVSPAELGKITAEGCFSEADLNHDGKLSFLEFRKWYSESKGFGPDIVTKKSPAELDIERLRQRLGGLSAQELFTALASAGDQLDRHSFKQVFRSLLHRRTSDFPRNDEVDIDRLFDVFDADGNGVVDVEELASGVSVLCDGSRDEKIRAAFELYDTDGNGSISLDEMATYLTSVFKVLYESNRKIEQSMGVDAEELALITATQCFNEAILDDNGQLSYDEFKRWYTDPNNVGMNAVEPEEAFVPFEYQNDESQQLANWSSLKEVQRLTRLEQYDVREVIRHFQSHSRNGTFLTKHEFITCFDQLISSAQGELKLSEKRELDRLVEKLFRVFDQDANGQVDFRELSMGLSILCGNTRASEKIKASFDLYDSDGDGFVTPEEMERYLACVFKVIYETVPGTKQRMQGLDPSQLASITTLECFADCDANHDGKLSLDEFAQWYLSSPDGIAMQDIQSNLSSWMSLNEVRKITGLANHSVEDVFEEFAKVTDRQGTLDRISFNRIFKKLSHAQSQDDVTKLDIVLNTLFRVFDKDGNGVVDFDELASGVSILCGGDKHSKARAAFALYDYDGDGFISLGEMIRYLTSIFKVVYETQPGTRERAEGASPDELALATAEQIFEEADLNGDGKLSIEEFTRWYTRGSLVNGHSKPQDVYWMDLGEVQRLTKLDQYSPQEAFEVLAQHANSDGHLTKKGFFTSFKRLMQGRGGVQLTQEEKEGLKIVLHRLFNVFDVDGNGVVDFSEIASGLSVLCGGHAHMKAQAAFRLYDYDDNGFISLDEMTRYLTCVFTLLYELQQGTREAMGGVSPLDLAVATANHAFAEADLNHDGQLSFDEFKRWYDQPEGQQLNALVPIDADRINSLDLDDIRRLTNLADYTAAQLFEMFAAEADDNEHLDRESFNSVFDDVVDVDETQTEDDFITLNFIMDRLFDLFDVDGNGIVDFAELTSGLTVLCGGSREDKIHAAFSLYDSDGDGYISLDEMTQYLRSVFRVVYETQPHQREKTEGATPDELAIVTAEQIFIDADLNHDGMLSFEEFAKWYGAPSAPPPNDSQSPTLSLSIHEVRKITTLDKYTPEEAFEVLALAGRSGYLDKPSFFQAFKELIQPSNDMATEEKELLDKILNRLFDVFDADGNGVVDFAEIASGLSVLCEGQPDDKAAAAFKLYDYNEDGFITLEEMTQYMTCVFRVMYELAEGATAKSGGYTVEQLARATSEQVFAGADLNGDGRLSFEEFQKWYRGSEGDNTATTTTRYENGETYASDSSLNVEEIGRLTHLSDYSASSLFTKFAGVADRRQRLSRDAFNSIFEDLVDMDGAESEEDLVRLAFIADRLFDMFDTDGNGFVDFKELSSGLTVLCGGSRDEKLAHAFSLFDANKDGHITMDEMVKYLSSVFTVMYETQPNSRSKMRGGSARDFAIATAQEVFAEYDLNKDNKLSFDEFRAWYTS